MKLLPLLLLLITHLAALGEVIKPEILYIEEMIEKEVDWPTHVVVERELSPSEGPRLHVYIAIPDLLRLKPNPPFYEIRSARINGSPFPASYKIKNYIFFETNRSTTLLEIEKSESTSTTPPTALKVSFSKAAPVLAMSRRCLSLYDVESYEPSGAVPFITHMECPNERKILIKTTPEVEVSGSKKSAAYNLFEFPVTTRAPRSIVRISPRLTAEAAEPGILGLLLRSKSDVLYSFEGRPRRDKKDEKKKRLGFAEIMSVGFTLSKYDPEIFASMDFKEEDWKSYFKLRGEFSLPYLLTGLSIENPIDGRISLLINRPIVPARASQRYSFGVGVEVLRRSPPVSYYAFGPRAQFSIEKLYSWNSRNHFGLFFSSSALSRTPLRAEIFDSVHEVEARLTFTQPTGKYFEPRVTLQSFTFKNIDKSSPLVFKIGLGARF